LAIEVGNVLEGRVTGVKPFGAFVALPEGKSGMVHISEVSNEYVQDISTVLHDGDAVKVQVINIAPDGKIALSIKPTQPAPELPELTPAQELAGYIRSRSAAALITPHALLVSEVENADELLAQMPQDPQCEDIVVRAGAKDTYYYSNANMSDNYAMIAQLIEDKDLCVMFAEMVRFNARVYPSATPLKYFQRSPYGLAPEEIEQTWKTMQGRPEFADIEELTNNQNERFLFSTQHLTRRYAKAISDVDDFCD